MKKILILGGSNSQLPAIICAKKMGYKVVTCDYLPDNPGHKYADQYQNISTVNKEKVLEFAKRENIDGIIAYASDPAAPTAGYVSDKLGLSGISFDVAKVFCEKDLFRQFQKDSGFNTPKFISIGCAEDVEKYIDEFQLPCMVKPVDSSGSKGVNIIRRRDEAIELTKFALSFSRCGRAIVEEYIYTPYDQLHGDGIVYKGELAFLELGDQRFKNSVPIGSSVPSTIDTLIMERVVKEVERQIKASGFSDGGINIEVRVTAEGEIYVLEIGPRTGGNYVPQLMELCTGFPEMEIALRIAMNDVKYIPEISEKKYTFQYIVGSDRDGHFKELYIDDYMQPKMRQKYVHKSVGDEVYDYKNSSGVVGVVMLQFDNIKEMEEDIYNIKKHIKVLVQEQDL